MAIGFTASQVPFKLSAEDLGYFNPNQAIDEGIKSAFMPKNLAQDLLSKTLLNKIRGAHAKYAEPMEQANLNNAQQNAMHQQILNQFLPQEKNLGLKGMQENLMHQQILNQFLPQKEQLGIGNMQEDMLRKQILNKYLPQKEQLGLEGMQTNINRTKADMALNPFREAMYDAKARKSLQGSNEDLNNPTKSTITNNQSLIESIDSTLPMLNALIENENIPGQGLGYLFHPEKQATYESNVAGVTDSLIKALKLPQTNESIDLVKKMIARRSRETEGHYKKRLQTVYNDLINRKKIASDILNKQSRFQLTPEQHKIARDAMVEQHFY